jgi:tRNA dimethylallyltransferase
MGKSRLATIIAPRLGAEIVSVDSMQVYRGMDIGTAKPDSEVRRRIPHHLMDIVDATENFSVAEYQKAARVAVEDIARGGKLPLLVGGTGLYFEAVVFDISFPPGSMDDTLRKELEEWAAQDPEGLKAELKRVDPKFASTQSYANMRRVIRAMEVYRRTGVPISSFHKPRGKQALRFPYVGAVITAPGHLRRKAIDARVEQMIQCGLVEEVKRLKEEGNLSATARQALGYKEILHHLDSGLPLEETINIIKKRSWHYSRRQLTWFRRIPGLRWFDLGEEDLVSESPPVVEEILAYFVRELEKMREGRK